MRTIPKEPERRLLGALLRIPYLTIVGRVYQGLVAAGYDDLRPAHLSVFQHIRAAGSRSSELAEEAQMTKQSMGALIDYLEERGYVERVPDPLDGRAKIVRLTARGEGVTRVARTIVLGIESEWASQLGEEQVRELRQLLEQVAIMLGEPVTI